VKKLFLIAASLFIAKVFALPVGNPSEASLFCSNQFCQAIDCASSCPSFDMLDLSVGYYGDYVFNRHLETIQNQHIDYSHISTNAGYVALTCWERFELFATFGASKFSFNTSLLPFNATNPSPRFDFETSTAFSWSVGAHGTLWQYKCFSLGAMGQYFTSKPHTDVWFIRANVSANSNDDHSRYSEWQLGAGISYHYRSYFVPYIALKWSRALWEFNDQSLFLTSGGSSVATIVNLQSSKQLGCAIGLSFAPFECENLAVTVEGRFGDEVALHVNGLLFF
jgi:Chlamydia major outer membrane protein